MQKYLPGKITFIVILNFFYLVSGQQLSENIRLNQTGFYPFAQKIAIAVKDSNCNFLITSPDFIDTVFIGKSESIKISQYSLKKTCIINFTQLNKTGTFIIIIPDIGYSYPFEIKHNIYKEIAYSSMRSFYYQRASAPLPVAYAGQWSRPKGHTDDSVLVHASAASEYRPEGTVISSSRGWYDAGDYGKYIVNCGITMYLLFSIYQDFPEYSKQFNLNIPEGKNKVPDVVDEILWNLRWMLTMQDPHDGGVYHKLTAPKFGGFVMPHEDIQKRYVVQKTTAASLNFSAVMSHAVRVLKKLQKELPGLADSCLKASEKAWTWAVENPDVKFHQQEMNNKFDPDLFTGWYTDEKLDDEFLWASSELYITSKQEKYLKYITLFADEDLRIPEWNKVQLLAYYSLISHQKELTQLDSLIKEMKNQLVRYADKLSEGISASPYNTIIGQDLTDFIWGSNSVAANQAIIMLKAFNITNNRKYINFALSNLDYLLGRNATGYSFLTGFGEKSTQNLHHRPSVADGLRDPIPGILAGGPNINREDTKQCTYPNNFADESYLDEIQSFATNENAINWNAAFTYLVFFFESGQKELGF